MNHILALTVSYYMLASKFLLSAAVCRMMQSYPIPKDNQTNYVATIGSLLKLIFLPQLFVVLNHPLAADTAKIIAK